MKKIKLILSLLMVLFISVGNVWATEDPLLTADFTAKTAGGSAYNTQWTYGDFTIVNAANNNKSWAYMKFGGKSATIESSNPCYVVSPKVTKTIKSIDVLTNAGNLTVGSVNEWGVYVYSDAECTDEIDHVTGDAMTVKTAETLTLTPTSPATSWPANSYYKVYFDLANTTTTNGIVWVDKINWYELTSDVIVKTLKSIAVSGMTTTYEQGDAFSFDGTCTATYSVTKNDVAQDDEEKVVTPTSVTSPDMTTTGDKTITVSFTDGGVTKTASYDITVSAALPKFIIDGNPLTTTATTEATTETYTGTDGSSTVNIVFSDGAKKQAVGTGAVNNFSSNPAILIGKTGKNIHNSTPFPGKITKFELYYNKGAANGTSISVTFSTTPLTEAATSGDNLYTVTFTDDTYKDKVYDCTSKVPEGALYFWYQVTSNSNSQVQFRVTYEADAVPVEKPTFTVAEGSYLAAQSVEIECETEGATIYYTMGENPADPTSASTPYTSAIAVDATTTIKAIAIKGDDESAIASATYTIVTTDHAGTELDPYSVADAMTVIDGVGTKADAYVSGIISQIDSYSDQYHSITYWISDDGTTTNQLQVYSGKGIDGADFSSIDDVTAKATVVVKGTLKKHNDTYEFDYNNELVSYAEPVEPIVTLKQSGSTVTALNLEATGVANQAIDIVCANFADAISSVNAKLYSESTCENEITSGAWVTDITVNNEKTQLTFNVADNDGAARQVWLKVTATDGTGNASAVLAISQVKYNAPASLPFAFNGGRDDIESTDGMTQEGLDSDYTGDANANTKLKFNTTGDNVIVNFNATPGTLTYDIKGNSYSTSSTFKVQESANGVDYTDVATYTNTTLAAASETKNLAQATRYVKFIYTTKDAGNVALGNITIVAPAAVETPTFSPAGGAYIGTQSVELSCTTDGAAIYYTTNGDDPDDSSTEYTAAISVDATMTIKAIAYKGNDHSEIASAAYTITPVLTDYYEKVTETAGIVEGTYLIVYEAGNVAFDGSLETLDAVSNTIDVTIVGDKIGVTPATEAATFYIDPTAGTIQSASGKYIGRTANTNGLNESATEAYTNTLSIDENGNAVIVGSGLTATYLRYNSNSGQTRFRYFTGNQQPIALYKLANEVIKQDPGISWDPESAELTLTDYITSGDYPEPALIILADLGDYPLDFITLSSDNESLATINKTNDGQIKISWVPDVTGTVHFTATFDGNETYKAVTAECTIKVNPAHEISTNPASYLNFGTKEQGATIDDKTLAVTLSSVAEATVVIAGDGAAAFSASPMALTASGDITVSASSANVGTFAATLTISDNAGNAADKVINLSLTVTEPETPEAAVDPTSEWVAATDADLVDGKEVLITGVKSDVTYAMGAQSSNGNNRTSVAGALTADVFTPGENTMSFFLESTGVDDNFYIKTSNGKYLYNASASGTSYLKTKADNENASWTIELSEGYAIITSVENTNRTLMRLNPNGQNSPLFNCYASGQSPITLYVPKPVTPTTYDVTYVSAHGAVPDAEKAASVVLGELTEDGWTHNGWIANANVTVDDAEVTAGTLIANGKTAVLSAAVQFTAQWTENAPEPQYEDARTGLNANEYYTMCLDKAVTNFRGASIWRVLSKAANGTDIILEEVTGTLDAGRPYIFYATAAKLEVVYTGDAVLAPVTEGNNGLIGSFSKTKIAQSPNNFIIYNNALYFVNSDNVYVGANRAYLDMTGVPAYDVQGNAPGRRYVTMDVHGNQVATGIENAEASEVPTKMLINGQLFIIRGEKMYNVNGQVVK